MNVAVLVVSYKTRELLLQCLASVYQQAHVGNVVVVDNDSNDGSAEAVERDWPAVKVVRMGRNAGFAAGVNQAARETHGDALLLLNPDATLAPEALERLVDLLERQPRAAAVGASLRYADGTYQDAAFAFPGVAQVLLDLFPVSRLARTRINGRYSRASVPREVDFTLGACMLIRATAWQDVGELDEGYFMYVEEVDWCRRARQRGWQVWHHPGASATHVAGQSTRQAADAMFVQLWRSRLRYHRRFDGGPTNAVIRLLVRLGMRKKMREARTTLSGSALIGRLAALDEIYRMAH